MDRDFTRRLVDSREAAGIPSAREAARMMKQRRIGRSVSNTSISEHEAGKAIPGADVLLAYARLYMVSPTWLLTGRGARHWEPDLESENDQRKLVAYMRTVGRFLQDAADAGVDFVGAIEKRKAASPGDTARMRRPEGETKRKKKA